MGSTPDEDAIAAAMPTPHIVFNELSRLFRQQGVSRRRKLTLADMLVAPHLDFLAGTPEWQPLTATTPYLLDWLHRINDRASLKATTWQRVAELAKAA